MKRPWTPEEEAVLRALYPEGDRDVILAALPGRPWHGIQMRASKLRILRRPTWKPEDDALLRQLWPECAVRTMRQRLRRSWAAIRHRAVDLGITKQRWAGYVTVNRAVRTSGLCTRAFLCALRGYQQHFATIPPGAERDELPSPSLVYRKKPGKYGQRMVDAQAAHDAVEWWLARETMTQAAKRMGVGAHVLSYAVHAAGVRVPKYARFAPTWWDAFLADRRQQAAELRSAA